MSVATGVAHLRGAGTGGRDTPACSLQDRKPETTSGGWGLKMHTGPPLHLTSQSPGRGKAKSAEGISHTMTHFKPSEFREAGLRHSTILWTLLVLLFRRTFSKMIEILVELWSEASINSGSKYVGG